MVLKKEVYFYNNYNEPDETQASFFIGIWIKCNENQLKETLKKNPKIVFDVIEENPEQFIEVVNRAAQKAQQQQYENSYPR